MSFESGFAKTRDVELYFERRGSGPPLLMIAGGGGDCGVYGPAAELLGETYTVLTYDRRGNSRSRLRGPPAETSLAVQSDDAVAIIEENGFESALVFGSSGGAIVVLDMAANHSDVVGAAVAHESPVPSVLPDAGSILASYHEIFRTMETDGWTAAFRDFLTFNELLKPGDTGALTALLEPGKVVPPGPLRELLLRESQNWAYMMECEVRPFVEYVPDLSAITRKGVPIAMAAGADTRAVYYHRASQAIAGRMGAEFVEFSGGHTPTMESPSTFAAELKAVFDRLAPVTDGRSRLR